VAQYGYGRANGCVRGMRLLRLVHPDVVAVAEPDERLMVSPIWELDVHRARARIGPGKSVLDLGASIGDFAIPAWQTGADVLAVEPLGPSVRTLEKAGIPVLWAALGPYDGMCQLLMPYDEKARVTGCYTMPNPNGLMPMFTLESILDAFAYETVDVVKCDVEGAEYEAFIGTGPEVLRRIRYLALEFHVWTAGDEARREGIGHRDHEPMIRTAVDLLRWLGRTHDLELEGSTDAGGTIYATLKEG
jgi:FkbM family methyltransferase